MTESEENVNEKLAKVLNDEPKEFDDHAELLASLQSTDKNDDEEIKETTDVSREEAENIDEDDIDMALKSLHKEDIVEENLKTTDVEATYEQKQEPSVKKENEKMKEKEKTDEELKDTDNVSKETKDNINSVDAKDDKLEEVTNKDVKIEKAEEKLAKEVETVGEPDASTAMEVDEETKKDLIDSLLGDQAAAMEDTAAETSTTADGKTGENKDDSKTKINLDLENIKELTEHESSLEDEFLNITPEKIDKAEEDEALTHTGSDGTVASTSAITTSAATETTEASSSTKEATITSEERVKSLISEWGDDEDDDDNDADLTANL